MPTAVVKLILVVHSSQKQPIGILAALSTGFDTVTRQLWLLVLPLGVDLFLWLGPRLKAAGLWSLVSFDIPSGLDAQTRLFAQELQTTIRQTFETTNWFVWLRPMLFGVPGLMGGAGQPPAGIPPAEWQLSDNVSFFVALAVLAVLGVGLGGLYWSLIARQARDGRVDWGAALGRMAVVWPRLIGLALLITGIAFLIWAPLVMLGLILGGALGLLGALAVMSALSLLAWLLFYVTFSIHGIVLYNQRVLDAVRASVRLGRTYFWSTFGLLAALVAIEWGMGLIWSLAPADSWLWAVSIAGNAFVVTGLSMATMVFYMDRVPIPRSTLAGQ